MLKTDFKRAYVLDNIAIRVKSDQDEPLDTLDSLLGALSVDVNQSFSSLNVYDLNINTTVPEKISPPDNFELVHSADTPDGLQLHFFASKAYPDVRHYILEGCCKLCINFTSQELTLLVNPVKHRLANHGSFIPMLFEILGTQNKTLLHTASLSVNGDAIVIIGQCGRGKSTSALAICSQMGKNAQMIADDACIIRQSTSKNSPPDMWPVPRDFKVSEKTVSLLGWLDKLPFSPNESDTERRIAYKHFNTVDPTQCFAPKYLLILQDRNGKEHKLSKCAPTEALTELIRLNLRTYGPNKFRNADNSFKAMAQLANNCRCWFLSVGPEISSLANTIMPLLNST